MTGWNSSRVRQVTAGVMLVVAWWACGQAYAQPVPQPALPAVAPGPSPAAAPDAGAATAAPGTTTTTVLATPDAPAAVPGEVLVRFAPNARDGLYRFSVHNFSDQSASGAQGMVDLNAEVRLIADGSTIRTFRASNATSGNTWRVFEMEIDGDEVTINPGSGSSGLGYFTAASAGDTGVFLTGGDGSPVVKE